jgi:hypothetical protein
MKLSISSLRKIIREEYRRMLYENEGEQNPVKLSNFSWDEQYNDPEMGTEQGSINFDISYMSPDGEVYEGQLEATMTSFEDSEKRILDIIGMYVDGFLEENGAEPLPEGSIESLVDNSSLKKVQAGIRQSKEDYNTRSSW